LEADGKQVTSAEPGEVVRLVGVSEVLAGSTGADAATISCPTSLAIGTVVSELARDPAQHCRRFLALLAVFAQPDGVTIGVGYEPALDVHAAHVRCVVVELCWRRGRKGLEARPKALTVGDVGEVWLEPAEPVCLEVFSACPPMGRFALRDQGITLAAGVVKEVHLARDPVECFDD